MVDAILNMGMPAPIDVQVSSSDLDRTYGAAQNSPPDSPLPGVGEVYIPQDMNYPGAPAESGPRPRRANWDSPRKRSSTTSSPR